MSTSYDNSINNFYLNNKSTLFGLVTKQFNEEDIKNESCAQLRVLDYYYAAYLVTLIYRDIEEGLVTTWNEVVTKYDLVELDKCFSCKEISLTKVFEDFGYPFIECNCGIECMGFQVSFEVEPDCNPCSGCGNSVTATYKFKDLLENLDYCINTLTD